MFKAFLRMSITDITPPMALEMLGNKEFLNQCIILYHQRKHLRNSVLIIILQWIQLIDTPKKLMCICKVFTSFPLYIPIISTIQYSTS